MALLLEEGIGVAGTRRLLVSALTASICVTEAEYGGWLYRIGKEVKPPVRGILYMVPGSALAELMNISNMRLEIGEGMGYQEYKKKEAKILNGQGWVRGTVSLFLSI